MQTLIFEIKIAKTMYINQGRNAAPGGTWTYDPWHTKGVDLLKCTLIIDAWLHFGSRRKKLIMILFFLVPYLNNLSTVALIMSHFRQFTHYCGVKNHRTRCYKRIKFLKTFLMPSIKHVWFLAVSVWTLPYSTSLHKLVQPDLALF